MCCAASSSCQRQAIGKTVTIMIEQANTSHATFVSRRTSIVVPMSIFQTR